MKNSNTKIAILGFGFVGKKVYSFFEDYFGKEKAKEHLLIYDPYATEIITSDKEKINEADLAIIYVPTERSKDGQADISIVEDTIKWLKTPLILIKSTIPPGTTKKLIDGSSLSNETKKKIAFSPEFVGESTYYHPFWNKMIEEPALIIGAEDKKVAEDILDFFQPILGPTKTFAITDTRTAELTKYVENTYFATKVTFANEIKKIADAFGVSYYELRELWALDPRVNKMHTSVFKNKPGFSGKCFPKDLLALIKASEKRGYDAKFLKSVWNQNLEFVLAGGKEKHGNPEWASESKYFLEIFPSKNKK